MIIRWLPSLRFITQHSIVTSKRCGRLELQRVSATAGKKGIHLHAHANNCLSSLRGGTLRVPVCSLRFPARAIDISSASASASASAINFSTNANTNINANSIRDALHLLQLSPHDSWTQRELRDAYFTAAKQCHPDARPRPQCDVNNGDGKEEDEELKIKADLSNRFLEITEAYELLQKCDGGGGGYGFEGRRRHRDGSSTDSKGNGNGNGNDNGDTSFIVTMTEEQRFRQACREYLGIDAEIVEESKRCPMFRKWLKGRTVDAFHWNLFLMKNGGLAPMLRSKKVLNLTEGDNGTRSTRRRRRKR